MPKEVILVQQLKVCVNCLSDMKPTLSQWSISGRRLVRAFQITKIRSHPLQNLNPGGDDIQGLILELGQRVLKKLLKRSAQTGITITPTCRWCDLPKRVFQGEGDSGQFNYFGAGVGAQGADLESTIKASGPENVLISSSRAIIYAGQGEFFEDAVRR